MKAKILDLLGYAIIIYGISVGFVILFIQMFESGIIVVENGTVLAYSILLIRPLPYVIAIYLYYDRKQRKQAYKQAHTLYDIEIAGLDKQIANYIILDNVRLERIKKYEKEISEFKLSPLAKKARKEIQDGLFRDTIKPIQSDVIKRVKIDDKIPFNNDNDDTEEQFICPECGGIMTRQTDKTVFCDNPSCTRKQWKKSEL